MTDQTLDLGEGVFTVRMRVAPGTAASARRIAQATQEVVDALLKLADAADEFEAAAGNSAGNFPDDSEGASGGASTEG